MKNKFLTFALIYFFVSSAFSQVNINNYKYVIVPKKFDFLKTNDEYLINSLTEFLFEKYGFVALKEGSDYPEDLFFNRCLALNSNVFKDKGIGIFTTKLQIQLKDCNGKIVFTSKKGESREKKFKVAYNFALRDAFKSIKALSYKYKQSTNLVLNKSTQEVKQTNLSAAKTIKSEQTNFPEIEGVSNILYAQTIDGGFQLIDSSPKVIYIMKKTHLEDVYLIQDKNALIYKKNNDWVIEYYSLGKLERKPLNIKF